jgi:hypothetical protein
MSKFVDLLPQIQKREDEDLRRFFDFLFFCGCKKITVIDKPDETRKAKRREGNFDYLIMNLTLRRISTKLKSLSSHLP